MTVLSCCDLAGELSPALAWVLCIALAASGLVITSANFGREITMLYAFGLFLGTIYSVPPLRRANSEASAVSHKCLPCLHQAPRQHHS